MLHISPRGRDAVAISNRPPAVSGRIGESILSDIFSESYEALMQAYRNAPSSVFNTTNSSGSSSATLTLESMQEALAAINGTVPDRYRVRPIRTQENLDRAVGDRQLHRALYEDFQRTMTMRINDAETRESGVQDGEGSSDERTND